MFRLSILICLSLNVAFFLPAQAEPPMSPASMEARLEELAQLLMKATNENEAATTQNEASDILERSANCGNQGEQAIARAEQSLSLLGEPSAADSSEIAEQRKSLEVDRERLRLQTNACKLASLRAEELISSATNRQRELRSERLTRRNHTLADELKNLRHTPLKPLNELKSIFVIATAWPNRLFLGVGIVLAVFLIGVGIVVRRRFSAWASQQRGRSGRPTFRVVVVNAIGHELHFIFLGLTIYLLSYLWFGLADWHQLWVRVALALVLLGLGRAAIRWYTGSYSPGEELIFSDAALIPIVRWRLNALLVVVLAGFTLFGRQWFAQPTDEYLLLWRFVLSVLLAATLIQALRLIKLIPVVRHKLGIFRYPAMLAALLTGTADLMGYHNLANYGFVGLLATFAGAWMLWTLRWSMQHLMEGVMSGQTRLSYRLRAWLGTRMEENIAELGWLKLIINLGLWLAFGILLVATWDVTNTLIDRLRIAFVEGIPLSGQRRIVPVSILIGIALFFVLMVVLTSLKSNWTKGWLKDIGLERGARDAVTTLIGYLGFIIAAVLGLTVAGFNFKGLALIAGALSVGIGFGLQNIVNNFFSGLVLLFEQPIKAGDFVSVGPIEGRVTSIRIRSTEIETQDRRTVIVPNSELISTQVTNWVLHDNIGRLRLCFSAVYGCDTIQVKRVAEAVAREHPEVITEGRVHPPKCLLMSFGDNGLNFELRVWIRQIEKRFDVTSDINFSLDHAFRDYGIEMAFPQREIRIKSADTSNLPPPKSDKPLPLDIERS